MSRSTSVVLATHGSVNSRALLEALAAQLERDGLADRVVVGFLRGEPDLSGVLRSLPPSQIVVVPLFTSAGHFARRVLPAAVRASGRTITIARSLGSHPRLAGLAIARIRRILLTRGLDPADTGVLVVGHGTRRHPASRRATLRLVRAMAPAVGCASIRAGFLDDYPSLEVAAAAQQSTNLVAIPFLIGGGQHADIDVLARLGTGSARVIVDEALIDYPEFPSLVASLVHGARRRGRRVRVAGGRVFLVGAGPGDPGLMTVRGQRLVRRADVVVYDRLISAELLASAKPGALLVNGGHGLGETTRRQDRLNRLLISHARRGRVVVRLKGGDPYVFGRGFEELVACREAGVDCHVVSGVSSAIAGPAAAGIPVTSRGIARSFAVITGQTETGEPPSVEPIAALAGIDTIVLMMGRASLAAIAGRLIAAGRPGTTPATTIERATLPSQRLCRGTLATIAARVDEAGLEAPMITVIGSVAALGFEETIATDLVAGAVG